MTFQGLKLNISRWDFTTLAVGKTRKQNNFKKGKTFRSPFPNMYKHPSFGPKKMRSQSFDSSFLDHPEIGKSRFENGKIDGTSSIWNLRFLWFASIRDRKLHEKQPLSSSTESSKCPSPLANLQLEIAGKFSNTARVGWFFRKHLD